MMKVYELAKELGVQFTMQISHNSEHFFGMHDSNIVKRIQPHFESNKLREDIRKIIKSELASYNLKRWGKAFVYYGMYMLTMKGKRPLSTKPGIDFFYMDPKGNIYPSVVHNYIMGNLTEKDFDTIWSSKYSEETRIKCQEDESPYWMGCMLRKALLDHKFQIAFWSLKNKFFGLKI
jgi:MoaA/NifB/PqqE/SkfB family radical SAM enzyme